MHHRNNISMRCTFLSLFICYLHNLMPLVEYVKKNKKEIKGSPKHPLIYSFYYYYFPYTNFGLYKSTVINSSYQHICMCCNTP
jgi:hypothetical protein